MNKNIINSTEWESKVLQILEDHGITDHQSDAESAVNYSSVEIKLQDPFSKETLVTVYGRWNKIVELRQTEKITVYSGFAVQINSQSQRLESPSEIRQFIKQLELAESLQEDLIAAFSDCVFKIN